MERKFHVAAKNKNKQMKHLISTLAIILFLCGCKYDKDIPDPEKYVKIYMPQAVDMPAKVNLVMADTPQTVIFGAAYGGPNSPDGDIEVKFKVDNALVAAFNQQHGTSYDPLPAGSYELLQTSAIIGKGKQNTAPLQLQLKTAGVLESLKQYLLPVSIDQVSNNIPVNESLRTAYFLVEAQRDGVDIRVVSFGKKSSVMDVDAVVEVLRPLNADLIVIREIDKNTKRSGYVDMPAAIAEKLGMHQFFAKAINHDGGEYGTAVLSRFPILDSAKYILTVPSGEPGPLAVIKVAVTEEQTLTFAGTHFNANAARRENQPDQLLDFLKDVEGPLIVGGNFNDQLAGDTYLKLKTRFSLICTESCAFNYPASNPSANTDYIIYAPADRFRVVENKVGPASTSDHLPVISQMQIYY